ncbi:MAG: tRNA pseudouridine synthase [Candidatus Parcubacteria bacterium]|jgi:tRNA pseudouridine55 synthase
MELPEILLIDKPFGCTSFDVIRILRKKTGVRKFGHAGTLDPRATGLMILGVEKGTKKLAEFLKLDKEYIAEIRLGERRTTGDLEGAVLAEKEVAEIFSSEKISTTVAALIGTHALPVSVYSAIKVNGTPLYKKAHKAEVSGTTLTEVPMREMVVYNAELLEHHAEEVGGKKRYVVKVRFHVASGVYIRSLAVYFGELLGYPAVLESLRRTKIGVYTIEEAKSLESF